MKKLKSVLPVLLATTTMIACSKSHNNNPTASGESGIVPKAYVNEGLYQVKEMITDYSNTRFHYNKEGGLDSVIVISHGAEYSRYIMFGKGKFTDSMHHYSGQKLHNVFTDFRYNSEGRIIGYTERRPVNRNAYSRFTLQFDKQGDIIAQKMESNSRAIVENVYTYNNDHDLVWNDMIVEGLHHYYSVRSDDKLNPFYKTDLLYIIFDGHDKQRIQLSKHNLTEVIYFSSHTTNYLNEYDRLGRLIKKTNTKLNDYYSLTYY